MMAVDLAWGAAPVGGSIGVLALANPPRATMNMSAEKSRRLAEDGRREDAGADMRTLPVESDFMWLSGITRKWRSLSIH
jgi:hypothetical protein